LDDAKRALSLDPDNANYQGLVLFLEGRSKTGNSAKP
jgi:hypothetical protein